MLNFKLKHTLSLNQKEFERHVEELKIAWFCNMEDLYWCFPVTVFLMPQTNYQDMVRQKTNLFS